MKTFLLLCAVWVVCFIVSYGALKAERCQDTRASIRLYPTLFDSKDYLQQTLRRNEIAVRAFSSAGPASIIISVVATGFFMDGFLWGECECEAPAEARQ